MMDSIDREAEREAQAMLKSRSYSTLPRVSRSDPKNHRRVKTKEKDVDILRILNILGR